MPNATVQKTSEAVWATWPCNINTFAGIASSAVNPIAYRVRRITVAIEPATASSTQLCGIMNCDNGAYATGVGFGDTFKRWRACNAAKRSVPGGNVEVSWPVNMPFLHVSDANKSSTFVPQILVACNDNKPLKEGTAWTEMQLELEYICAA